MTEGFLLNDVHQEEHAGFTKGKFVIIDGYCQAADNRGYAVCIQAETQLVAFVPLHCLKIVSITHDHYYEGEIKRFINEAT